MCIFEDTDPEHVREVIPLLPIICAERGAVSSLFLQYQTWHEMRTKWTCVRAFKATHAGCSFVPCEPRCTPIESPVSLVLRTQHNPYNHQSMSQWNSMNWGPVPIFRQNHVTTCYHHGDSHGTKMARPSQPRSSFQRPNTGHHPWFLGPETRKARPLGEVVDKSMGRETTNQIHTNGVYGFIHGEKRTQIRDIIWHNWYMVVLFYFFLRHLS